MKPRIVIVGGGLAGLAAAVGLAPASLEVTLLESRPRLGGRAGSFRDHDTGEWIDACQHVAMGCCTNLRHFARLTGIDDLFATQDELLFIGPEGQRCRFGSGRWPAPLHLAGAFAGLSYLSRSEQLRLARDVRHLSHRRWQDADEIAFEDWLSGEGRTADLRERFWDVILVSALSETADRIALPHARKVFVEGFLAHADGWRVQIPAVSLEELYGRRLTDWLAERGVKVQTAAGVRRLEEQGGRIVSATLRSGEEICADEFVLAVPWHRAGELMPAERARQEPFTSLDQIESAPITSVHLWFDRPVIDVPHAVLVGRLSQWVFRREALRSRLGELPADSAADNDRSTCAHIDYVQVVISASRSIAGRSQVAVIEEVVADLSSVWPAVGDAELTSSRLVTEHRAVFSPLPGVERLRPNQQSPIENLQLAGDWTQTGWPATMEGAVKSGFLAAENVLARQDRRASLVQPGLKPGWISRVLLKI